MSKASKIDEGLKNCGKILSFLMAHKDAAPFLEPVQWKEWGLLDYPKVVKNPMDLGSVKRKLESGGYSHPKEFKHDVNLVWNNCMTYNADGSEYWNMAVGLKRIFEEKYTKSVKDDEDTGAADSNRPPTLLDKKMFSQNIYNISSEDLGRVVQILDSRCEACIKKIDPEDIEIDIDAIESTTFWTVDTFVKDCLPGNRKGKKSGAALVGSSKPAAGAAGEQPKAKKARV